MSGSTKYPEVEGLFTWPSDEPSLIGARCEGCDALFFPAFAVLHRPGCVGGPVGEHVLKRRGTLLSYTIQHYPPPPPYPVRTSYQPFILGTVALEGLQIPGEILGCGLDDVRVGLEVEVVVDTLYFDEVGDEALTWKFKVLGTASVDKEGKSK
jgi:uncharacterized protein